MPHIRGIVAKAYEKDRPETFAQIGVDVIDGSASFVDANHVEAAGRVFSAAAFIVATGTTPFIPPVEGLRDIDFLTNESIYDIEEVPRSLIILGGGVDGLEYASAFALLGVETTVVEMATRLLPMVDLELVNHLARALTAHGVRLMMGTRAAGFARRGDKIELSVEKGDGSQGTVIADRVIVAVGRKPDLEGLSLDKAGVRYNARGIVTNKRLRTSAPNIYACGDIAGPYQLASTAEAQAILAATNASLPVKRSVDYSNNVYVVFTDPPLAYLGLTEAQAYEVFGDKLRVYRFDYRKMRRAIVDGTDFGVAKVLCDGRGRIVGAHIFGEGAPEVIHQFQTVKALNKPLHKLNAVTHAYPTYAQALVGRAAQLAFLDRMGESKAVRLALKLLPGHENRLRVARDRLAETGPEGVGHRPEANREGTERSVGACEIGSRTAGSGFVVIDITGHLDGCCERELQRVWEHAVEGSRNIVFNLSGLVHADPEGAGLLVKAAALAARKGKGIGAFGLRDDVRDIFRLTRLDEAITLFDGEKEALCCPNLLERRGPVSVIRPAFTQSPLAGWARSVDRISITDIPDGAMNMNVQGRRPTSPIRGFGRLWEKRYRLRLDGTDMNPQEIILLWRSTFAEFWPKGNKLFPSGKATLEPGTAAVLNLSLPGGLTLATGILVMFAGASSFSFMTVEGHMLSGWITFSSFRENGAVVIEVHPLFRAGDPLMELAFRFGGAGQEDRFWHQTLHNLARRMGSHGTVEQHNVLVDDTVNWGEKKNLWWNAAIRSALSMPVYIVKRLIHRNK
jgi:anti-anti-sigma factor